MLLRRGHVQNAVKSLLQNRQVFGTGAAATANTSTAQRFISTSEGNNSDFVNTKQKKISPSQLDHIQKMKKTTRTLSTLNDKAPVTTRTLATKEETREFMAVFPDVVRDLREYLNQYDSCAIATNWFAKAMQYTVPGGKKTRGLASIIAYKQLMEKELTPENVRRAQYVGWCIEMFQAALLLCDDLIDGGQVRRRQACWYLLDDVGLISVNDALMIENAIYYILKKYFGDTDMYIPLVDLFRETTIISCAGQSLDWHMSKKNVSEFTMEKYKAIAIYKTSYYTFYLPIFSAMIMAGITDPEVYRQAKTILLEMGEYYQIQDDFMDSFADIKITGKVGTDIPENKCTWLAIVFMQRASEEQKKEMMECYGKKDPVKAARVRELYRELGLPNTYAVYEEETYNMIRTHIQQTSRGVPHKVFFKVLDSVYQRHL